jgi:hypothetical protein
MGGIGRGECSASALDVRRKEPGADLDARWAIRGVSVGSRRRPRRVPAASRRFGTSRPTDESRSGLPTLSRVVGSRRSAAHHASDERPNHQYLDRGARGNRTETPGAEARQLRRRQRAFTRRKVDCLRVQRTKVPRPCDTSTWRRMASAFSSCCRKESTAPRAPRSMSSSTGKKS